MTCPTSLHFLQAAASQNVLTPKFTMNQLREDFITKDSKRYHKEGQFKVVQLLQIGTGITKRDNFYLKVVQ